MAEQRRAAYAEKLKDPRWQKKRLEILQRDDFACQICFDTQSTLHVHHLWYENGREPWDIDDRALVTLCETCHEDETIEGHSSEAAFVKAFKRFGCLSPDLDNISVGLAYLAERQRVNFRECLSSAIGWFLSNRDRLDEIEARYMEHLRSNRAENG